MEQRQGGTPPLGALRLSGLAALEQLVQRPVAVKPLSNDRVVLDGENTGGKPGARGADHLSCCPRDDRLVPEGVAHRIAYP